MTFERELLEVLEALERGELSVTPVDCDPATQYAGDLTYRVSNGWILVVFDDCDSWDYLDSAIAPDGRSWTYPDGDCSGDEEAALVAYCPDSDVSRLVYGIPE